MADNMILAGLQGISEGILEGLKLRKEIDLREREMKLKESAFQEQQKLGESKSEYYRELIKVKQAEVGLKNTTKQEDTSIKWAKLNSEEAGKMAQTSVGLMTTQSKLQETISKKQKNLDLMKQSGADQSVVKALEDEVSGLQGQYNTIKSHLDNVNSIFLQKSGLHSVAVAPKQASQQGQQIMTLLTTAESEDDLDKLMNAADTLSPDDQKILLPLFQAKAKQFKGIK